MKTRKELFDERQKRQSSAQIIPFPIRHRNQEDHGLQIWRVVRVMCPPRQAPKQKRIKNIMAKNPIENPQVAEKNANRNIEQVRREAHDSRNHGNTKEERDRS